MSMRKAINDMCKSCNYDDKDTGTWLAQIESCTMTTCPLYTYRPITEASRKIRANSREKTTHSGQFGSKQQ